MTGIRGVTLVTVQPPGGVVGPTGGNTDERRLPPDNPSDMLASTAHWSIQGLQGSGGSLLGTEPVLEG